jgi:prophage regulatory protein
MQIAYCQFEKCSHYVLSGGAQRLSLDGTKTVSHSERIIRLKTVLARTGLSRSTVYRKIAEGTFPPQVRISIHGAGWHESSIDTWIADPAAYRFVSKPVSGDQVLA